jgi:hypothetical protein
LAGVLGALIRDLAVVLNEVTKVKKPQAEVAKAAERETNTEKGETEARS